MPSRSSTLSNAFSKTMKLVNKGTSSQCTVQWCSGEENLEPCSLGLLRNLVCSGLNFGSMAPSIILRNVLQNTLLEMSWNRERCLCLATVVTIVEAPFFGILCIRRMLLSIGIPKRFQILAKRSASTKNEVVASAFSSSTWRESIPGDFAFFIALIVVSTSTWEWVACCKCSDHPKGPGSQAH